MDDQEVRAVFSEIVQPHVDEKAQALLGRVVDRVREYRQECRASGEPETIQGLASQGFMLGNSRRMTLAILATALWNLSEEPGEY